MNITQENGTVKGMFDMGHDYQMRLEATVQTEGLNSFIKMTGYGIPGTETDNWVYDYLGLFLPIWPEAVSQVPTIVDSCAC